jgi:hypothetical protein
LVPPVRSLYGPDEIIGLDEIVGAGTSGLRPVLSSSVAPSGIVPPLRVVKPGDPGVESGDASPVDPPPGGDEVQPPVSDGEPDEIGIPPESPAVPPPSKVEFDAPDPMPAIPAPVVPIPAMPAPLTPYVPPKQLVVALLNGVIDAGLKPPMLISVDPSGIPTGPAEFEPIVPSGDVTPSAGPPGIGAICAAARPELSTSMTIEIPVRRMTQSPRFDPVLRPYVAVVQRRTRDALRHRKKPQDRRSSCLMHPKPQRARRSGSGHCANVSGRPPDRGRAPIECAGRDPARRIPGRQNRAPQRQG